MDPVAFVRQLAVRPDRRSGPRTAELLLVLAQRLGVKTVVELL